MVLEWHNRSVTQFALTYTGETLLLWTEPDSHSPFDETARRFVATPEGTYDEVDTRFPVSGASVHFDPSNSALVRWTNAGIIFTPLGGGPSIEHTLNLPDRLTFMRGAGSGRAFTLATSETGEPVLYWWESISGVAQGNTVLPEHSSSRFTDNGRALLLWEAEGAQVHVVDTTDPTTLVSVPLAACSKGWSGHVSSDGHWLVVGDRCTHELSLFDLTVPTPTADPLGITASRGMGFAVDTPQFVTVDAAGVVQALDVTTGTSQPVLQLPEADAEFYGEGPAFGGLPIYLSPNVGLLAYQTSDHFLRVVGLGGNTTDTVLPTLPFETTTMELIATRWDPSEGDRSSYEFTGTVEFADGPYDVTGTVHGASEQRYRPVGSPVEPLAPPPLLRGEATFESPTAPARRYDMEFRTVGGPDVGYAGTLTAEEGVLVYEVTLRPQD